MRRIADEVWNAGDLSVVDEVMAPGATYHGHLPGVEPTGRAISIGGITIHRFAEGRIVAAWEELDLLGMWRRLGVVTLPGHDRESPRPPGASARPAPPA